MEEEQARFSKTINLFKMKLTFGNIEIKAIYSTVPPKKISFKDLNNLFGQQEVEKITKVTGITSVRIADAKTTASDLCAFSAEKLLKELDVCPSQIDGIIFVSQTRDYQLPQTSNVLQHKLNLPKSTVCFDLPLGCSGYINGLLQASLLIQGGCENVLVLAGDTTSKLISNKDRANRLVFGDAGSATLICKGESEIGFLIYNDGSGYNDLIIPAGGYRLPSSDETKIVNKDTDDNYRSKEHLYMNGMNVFNFVISEVPKLIKEIVKQSPYKSLEQVDGFYLHQANKFIVDYVRKKLKLSKEKVPVEVDGYGNTGPSSIPLLLTLLNEREYNLANTKKSVLSGFGVGLSWAACYANLENTKIQKTEDYEK